MNSLAKDIAESLMSFEIAQEIWLDLRSRFHHRNGLRIFQLKQKLHALTQGAQDVSAYFTRHKTLWDELCHY